MFIYLNKVFISLKMVKTRTLKGIVTGSDCAASRPHNNCSLLDLGICVVDKWDGLPFLKKSHSADIYIYI